MSHIIEKGQIFSLGCRSDDCSLVVIEVVALQDIDVENLRESIDRFETSSVNSYKSCRNGSCSGNDDLPLAYLVCPYCGSHLEEIYRIPTIQQFLEGNYYKLQVVKPVIMINTVLSDEP